MSKLPEDEADKRSISAPIWLWDKADAKIAKMKITLSRYIQDLMKADIEKHVASLAPRDLKIFEYAVIEAHKENLLRLDKRNAAKRKPGSQDAPPIPTSQQE